MIKKVKAGGTKRIDEQRAMLLLSMQKGSRQGAFAELTTEINRQVSAGAKWFIIPCTSENGAEIPIADRKKIVIQLNSNYSQNDFGFRVRYSEEEKGFLIVPAKNYEAIFGSRKKEGAA